MLGAGGGEVGIVQGGGEGHHLHVRIVFMKIEDGPRHVSIVATKRCLLIV